LSLNYAPKLETKCFIKNETGMPFGTDSPEEYAMEQLKKAGVDLTRPETIMAVINRMDELVTLLEKEINKLK